MTLSLAGLEHAAIGYTANAVWQVPLVFAAAWAAARFARRCGPRAEHRVWVAAMLLESALPACRVNAGAALHTLLEWVLPSDGAHAGIVRIAVGAGGTQAVDGLRIPGPMLGGTAAVFLASLLYFAARLGWGILRTQALRRRARRVSLAGDAAALWLKAGGDWRMTEIAESSEVSGPVTVGVLRPAVVVPVGFFDRVCADDVEAVLAHELAHVRRWDFTKNLLYEAASLGVTWHPLVWLVRARVTESREMVCDAMAADAVAGRERYARSLLRLAAMVSDRLPARTLHAIGIFDANSFERRVMQLTRGRVEMRGVQRFAIAAACAVMAVATCATAMALHFEVSPEPTAAAAKGGGGGAENPKVDQTTMKSTNRPMPVYPAEAKANHDTIGGAVVLGVTIGKDGAVAEIHVEKSLRADYDRSALEAVRSWRWEPYLLNGEPTEVDTNVTVTYSSPTDPEAANERATAEMDEASLADEKASKPTDGMPKLIKQVEAVYPAQARAQKNMLNGSVLLGLTVKKDGSIDALHVDKSLRADYDESALAAVKQYRFEPALASGEPVAKNIVVEVSFQSY